MIVRPLTGRSVVFGFAAFFGVVFAANGLMMWLAARTFDGMAEEDAYRTGRDYNRVLEEARAQDALGWRTEFVPAGTGTVVVSFRDAEGRPIENLTIVGRFASPVAAHEDRSVQVTTLGLGRFRLEADLPRPGNWRLELEAVRDGETVLRMREAIEIAP